MKQLLWIWSVQSAVAANSCCMVCIRLCVCDGTVKNRTANGWNLWFVWFWMKDSDTNCNSTKESLLEQWKHRKDRTAINLSWSWHSSTCCVFTPACKSGILNQQSDELPLGYHLHENITICQKWQLLGFFFSPLNYNHTYFHTSTISLPRTHACWNTLRPTLCFGLLVVSAATTCAACRLVPISAALAPAVPSAPQQIAWTCTRCLFIIIYKKQSLLPPHLPRTVVWFSRRSERRFEFSGSLSALPRS